MGAEKEQPKQNSTKLFFGLATPAGAGGTVATHYSECAGQSMEQIWCPVQIVKTKTSDSPTPGFQKVTGGSSRGGFGGGTFVGPTAVELDPYFSNMMDGNDGTEFFAGVDYKLMVHEDNNGTTTDLNINKIENKRNVEKVRVNAHRAPLILSGWGFDLGDRPVPRMSEDFPNNFKFNTETPYNRTTWKSGPLAVAWDDERQVWSGGPQIVCGIALGKIKAPKSPCKPTSFGVKLFRKTSEDNVSPYVNGISTELDAITLASDRITVMNRDPSLEQDFVENAMFVIAIRLNYEWLPLWVGCPEDEIDDSEDDTLTACCI